jgi:hypothetical protein
MDWHSSGRIDAFEYTRVDKNTFEDKEIITVLENGGQIDRNALTPLKVSATVPFFEWLDVGNDYLRIYSISTLFGETVRIAHGTFLVSVPSSTLSDSRNEYKDETGEIYSVPLRRGTANLYSLLLLLQEQKLREPLTIYAGTQTVLKAFEIITDAGLNVIADGSLTGLQKNASFDTGTTYLEIVNWLLDYAGFNSANVDGYGNIILKRYQDPSSLSPVVVFSDTDPKCTFAPDVLHEFDIFSVPNQVILTVSNADTVMNSIATNDDPNSRYSTVSRGRIIAHTETIDDIESQAALDAKAQQILISLTSAVESVIVKHPYEPFEMLDGALLNYSKAEVTVSGSIPSSKTILKISMPCETRVRRFVRA